MKKRFRKTLALLLAALMIAGLVPGFSLSAFADGEDDYPVITADSELVYFTLQCADTFPVELPFFQRVKVIYGKR